MTRVLTLVIISSLSACGSPISGDWVGKYLDDDSIMTLNFELSLIENAGEVTGSGLVDSPTADPGDAMALEIMGVFVDDRLSLVLRNGLHPEIRLTGTLADADVERLNCELDGSGFEDDLLNLERP